VRGRRGGGGKWKRRGIRKAREKKKVPGEEDQVLKKKVRVRSFIPTGGRKVNEKLPVVTVARDIIGERKGNRYGLLIPRESPQIKGGRTRGGAFWGKNRAWG